MRHSLNLFLLGSAALVAACWGYDLAESCAACLCPQQRAEAAQLDRLLQQRDAFAPSFAAVVQEVARNELSLRDAVQRLAHSAAESHPTFLEYIAALEPGDNLDAKLAHNVLRAFAKDAVPGDPAAFNPALYARLEREFADLQANKTPMAP